MKNALTVRLISLMLTLVCLLGCLSSCGNDPAQSKPACDHPNTSWVVEKEPTLYEEGRQCLKCASCGASVIKKPIPDIDLTREEIVEKLKVSAIKVMGYDSDGETQLVQGSGFFIDSNGTFITNAHVVEGCYFLKIKSYYDGKMYDVDMIYAYNFETSDYAICHAKDCRSSPVEFYEYSYDGAVVYALGFPQDASMLKVTDGRMDLMGFVEETGADGKDKSQLYYRNTAVIEPGSSGGILADAKGSVLGITSGVLDDGTFYAVKYKDFKNQIKDVYENGKSPMEYFHSVVKILPESCENIEDYFDVEIHASSVSDDYRISLKLKDEYRNLSLRVKDFKLILKLESVFVCAAHAEEHRNTEYWEIGLSNTDLLHGNPIYWVSSPSGDGHHITDSSCTAEFVGGSGEMMIIGKD